MWTSEDKALRRWYTSLSSNELFLYRLQSDVQMITNWFVFISGMFMALGAIYALMSGEPKVAILSGLYATANVIISMMKG
ncbi:hypothetical protein LCGC14_1168670 [marine sediment metagenome]|uniref:Uncharacterized protein n=1 Tax=marine sediment metagenome TaxID=412755 RepID=A0A0F9PW02_9ZZZZ